MVPKVASDRNLVKLTVNKKARPGKLGGSSLKCSAHFGYTAQGYARPGLFVNQADTVGPADRLESLGLEKPHRLGLLFAAVAP